MWPGFDVRLITKEAGIFLNIEPCYKVVRHETAHDVMKRVLDTCDSRNLEFAVEILKEFELKTVVTLYNNKTYPVSGVALDMSPKSKFTDSSGNKVTFLDYYKTKYNIEIADINQALLVSVNKRSG